MDGTIKVTDVAIFFATFLGPLLAVQVQKFLERNREIKQRRLSIFRTLMTTRVETLSVAHVEALNSVPIEFYGSNKNLKAIVNCWKAYLDHLGQVSMAQDVWGSKRVDLYVNLLTAMSTFLGYEFNRVEISNEIYFPAGRGKVETDQEIIRRGLVRLLSGEFALPIEVKQFSAESEVLKEQEELRKSLLSLLNGDKSISVDVKAVEKSP